MLEFLYGYIKKAVFELSLIISLKIPDAIIVASDSNMTITTTDKNSGNVVAISHTEHTPKMVIFRERLAVTYCDNMSVSNSLSVLQFLLDMRRTVSKNISPKALSEKILEEYIKISARRTVFLVSGYIGTVPAIFRVDTKEKSVKECLATEYGAAYNGITDYVHKMMCSIENYNNISIKDGIELVSTMMYCMSSLSKFWKSQSIGGDIDVYLMCRDRKSKSGWIEYGQFIPIKINNQNAIKKEIRRN